MAQLPEHVAWMLGSIIAALGISWFVWAFLRTFAGLCRTELIRVPIEGSGSLFPAGTARRVFASYRRDFYGDAGELHAAIRNP